VRIVSLVPAGTEIAFALGAGGDVVAVTHDCDFPPAARKLPRVTRSAIAPGSDSLAIDAQVRAAAERGEVEKMTGKGAPAAVVAISSNSTTIDPTVRADLVAASRRVLDATFGTGAPRAKAPATRSPRSHRSHP